MDIPAFLEGLDAHASKDEVVDAVDRLSGERPRTKEQALAFIEAALDGADSDRRRKKILTEVLAEVYAENLRAWTKDVLDEAFAKDPAIAGLCAYYLSDDEPVAAPIERTGPGVRKAFDVDWFLGDLETFFRAVELRQLIEQFTDRRFSDRDEALEYLSAFLRDSTVPFATVAASVESLLSSLPAERIRALFDEYDIEYENKGDAVEILADAYLTAGERVAEDGDGEDDGDGYSSALPIEEERRRFYAEVALPAREFEARPYQTEAVSAAQRALRPGARVQIHIATGGGKTGIANNIVRDALARGGRVLWMTKDWSLLRQAALDLGQRHRLIRELGRIGGSAKDLRALPEGEGRVRYTTVQTLSRRKGNALRGWNPTLTVWDECHWGVTGKVGDDVLRLLQARQVPILGLTATPKQGSGFKVVYRKTFAELVTGTYLAEPILEEPARTNVRVSARLNQFNDLDDETLRSLADNPQRNKFIVDHWIASPRYDKTMVFACFVDHAVDLTRRFAAQGVNARVVHSRMLPEQNRDALEQFRAGTVKVLVNVAMLTHGVDVPDAKTVFLARPTTSEILFAQMVGRAARRTAEKTHFYIVSFKDDLQDFNGHLYTAKEFYEGAGLAARPILPSSPPSPRVVRRARHGFDPAGQPSVIAQSEFPELVGLWYRQGQSFGVELEISRDDFDEDISEHRWRQHAELLRSAVLKVLKPEVVSPAVLPDYEGIDGKDHSVWNFEKDPSAGWEVTSCILENQAGFDQVARTCRALEEVAAREGFKVNWRTGTHVHIGWRDDSRTLSIRQLKRLIQLVKVFEPALATLVSPSRIREFDGTYDMGAPNGYCAPIATSFPRKLVDSFADLDDLSRFLDELGSDQRELRYVTLNILPLRDHNTVEVRLHNGTLDSGKLTLWLSLWQQILWTAEGDRPIEEVEDCTLLVPDGDIVALAERYLVDPRLNGQRDFLRKLDVRRREVVALWRSRPELAPWCAFEARWRRPA